mgnify:CR=1 FL=1
MISVIQPSLLAFYGGTVVAVIGLFSVTTRFGATRLNAPPRIDGRYPITTTHLPGCLGEQTVVLQINQSGIFVNGALLPTQAQEGTLQAAAKRPPLTGEFDHQTVWLSGTMPQIPGCQTPNNRSLLGATNLTDEAITIEAKVQGTRLTGTLQLRQASTRTSFTAQRAAPVEAGPN